MPLDPTCVKGVIWDLDNTLYRFTDEFIVACNKAAAKAAKDLGIDLSYEDTLKLAEHSEAEHGYSMHGYVTDHGLSYADLHFPFHQAIDENVIAPIDGMAKALEKFKGKQVILTNASRCWAARALKFIGAEDIFHANDIIPMEDVDFEPKARSEKGFYKACDILGLSPEEVLMADDLDRNLYIPHKMGMQTIYMHHDDPMVALPDFIDDQYENPVHLLTALG